MVKNLINKVGGGTKKARRFASALGLSGLLLFNGYFLSNCKSPSSPIIPDSKPTAILSVSPESGGAAPLEVKIQLRGSPREDIVKYILKISDNSTGTGLSTYGINEPVGNKAFRRVETTRGEHQKKGIQRDSKTREEIRNQGDRGVDVQSREIERLGVRDKVEDYAEAPEIYPEEFSVLENVQPYKMVVLEENFNGVEEIVESSYPIDITRIYDNRTNEKVEIFFIGEVTASDGRVSAPVSKNIIISPRGDIYISGTLRCNETDSAVRGMLKVFDSNRNPLETNESDDEGYILTNSSGNFNFQVKKIASELEEIIIRAAHGTPGNLQSWVRTINIPTADNSNVEIVAVPYGEFKANPDEFRNFMYEVTHADIGETPRMFDYSGFNKGFVIIKENLDDSLDDGKPKGKGKFSNEQVQYIKNIITPSKNNVQKILSTSNYSIKTQANSENYMPGAGVIYIIPSTAPGGNPDYGGFSFSYRIGKLIQGADIYLRDNLEPNEWALRREILHETGHIIYEHTTNPNSIMGKGGITYYTSLDLKGTDVIYEKTYLRDDWRSGYPVENLKYILGRDFDKWN